LKAHYPADFARVSAVPPVPGSVPSPVSSSAVAPSGSVPKEALNRDVIKTQIALLHQDILTPRARDLLSQGKSFAEIPAGESPIRSDYWPMADTLVDAVIEANKGRPVEQIWKPEVAARELPVSGGLPMEDILKTTNERFAEWSRTNADHNAFGGLSADHLRVESERQAREMRESYERMLLERARGVK
jgi:hypothetical protein